MTPPHLTCGLVGGMKLPVTLDIRVPVGGSQAVRSALAEFADAAKVVLDVREF